MSNTIVVPPQMYHHIAALPSGGRTEITIHGGAKAGACQVVTAGRKPIKCRAQKLSNGGRKRITMDVVRC